MVNSYVGIDSTTFYHEGLTRFKAPLGVAIEVENFEEFDDKYSIIIKELKTKYHLETPRSCIKGYFVSTIIGNDGAFWFTNEFIDKIMSSLKTIFVAHAIISPSKLPEITFSNRSKMPTMKFVDILTSSFNHIIAWNFINKFAEINQSHIFIDYFTGIETKAWNELEKNNNIFVLSAGEYCNSLISTADLFCKFINDNLYRKREKLGFDGISTIFSSKKLSEIKPNMNPDEIQKALDVIVVKLYQTNNSPFSMITPNSKRNMEVGLKLKHPVSFVLLSHKLPKEKGVLENTPIFDLLVNDAYQNHGCVRSINLDDLTNEIRYMKTGDRIITIGNEALEQAKYLKSFGLSVDIITSDDLLKNEK